MRIEISAHTSLGYYLDKMNICKADEIITEFSKHSTSDGSIILFMLEIIFM